LIPLEFPVRVYTEEEVRSARKLVQAGYRHPLIIKGGIKFTAKVNDAIELVKVADYYDFLTSFIRQITEIDGLTQLREADVSIWANKFAVKNPVDAASLFVQKANHMKEYLEGKLYYGGSAEKRSVEKRKDFLKSLKERSNRQEVIDECERLLKMWEESSLVY